MSSEHADTLVAKATDMINWSYETGWDKQHGGLFYFLDAKGTQRTELEWDMKLWWPITEAMIAYALLLEKDPSNSTYTERLQTITKYALEHFADNKHGAWYGYLSKQSKVSMTFKGGPYKGFFHVPRGLLVTTEILQRVAAAGTG